MRADGTTDSRAEDISRGAAVARSEENFGHPRPAAGAQAEHLVEGVGVGGRILLLFDEDGAGRKGRRKALARLAPHVYVRVIELPRRVAPAGAPRRRVTSTTDATAQVS